MSGFGYWSHDIGGFEHTSTPDVYKRWAAFGLLSSHSRLHGSQSYRVPWVYDEEAVDVVRTFTKLKGFSYALPLQKCNLYFTDRYSYDEKYGSWLQMTATLLILTSST